MSKVRAFPAPGHRFYMRNLRSPLRVETMIVYFSTYLFSDVFDPHSDNNSSGKYMLTFKKVLGYKKNLQLLSLVFSTFIPTTGLL